MTTRKPTTEPGERNKGEGPAGPPMRVAMPAVRPPMGVGSLRVAMSIAALWAARPFIVGEPLAPETGHAAGNAEGARATGMSRRAYQGLAHNRRHSAQSVMRGSCLSL